MYRALSDLLTSAFARGFLGALIAIVLVAIALLLYHLYTDHVAFHILLDYMNQHADQINQLPKSATPGH